MDLVGVTTHSNCGSLQLTLPGRRPVHPRPINCQLCYNCQRSLINCQTYSNINKHTPVLKNTSAQKILFGGSGASKSNAKSIAIWKFSRSGDTNPRNVSHPTKLIDLIVVFRPHYDIQAKVRHQTIRPKHVSLKSGSFDWLCSSSQFEAKNASEPCQKSSRNRIEDVVGWS